MFKINTVQVGTTGYFHNWRKRGEKKKIIFANTQNVYSGVFLVGGTGMRGLKLYFFFSEIQLLGFKFFIQVKTITILWYPDQNVYLWNARLIRSPCIFTRPGIVVPRACMYSVCFL